jgi:hypothetical protein
MNYKLASNNFIYKNTIHDYIDNIIIKLGSLQEQ